ncbi:cross-pathway control protein 1 [Phialemonium atrogriseum]|uniref:Cross-pathway control protein 1 n=1 Tax=Phialemonium atrogriseum TaxID=1093897 RepID=A0AAJ0BYS8_9PEZI|nr:cross-pathway control protein 1 [Phialemonium atrogriseum]KAK1766985.1 cross-pathway control protein 1 [Phialemonium atrogriseum]
MTKAATIMMPLPEKVDLNFDFTLSSSSSSSRNTVAISAQDLPVFNTDPNQSTWLPSSSSSLPAQPAPQQHLQPFQQDFVLFDQPIKQTRQPNRSVSQPSAIGGVISQEQQQHRHQQQYRQQPSPASLQNHRVASIIQATGHTPSSSAFTNRFSSPVQNPHQFYASSAPSSSVALNRQNRPARPPVPLFSHSTGSIPQGNMNLQGWLPIHHLQSATGSSQSPSDLDLEDFTAFEGGASTAYSSPAISTAFDFSASGSSSASNMGTVSPQDLLIQEPFMSAPNSSALTALTSPSIYNESPEFHDSYDVSPNFSNSDFDASAADVWYPLFPPENKATQQRTAASESSPAEKSEDLESSESGTSHRRRKSGHNSPGNSGRHSSVSGVNSRKRDKPLPPIIIEDPNDTVAMKRARNTLAARKSRERKAQRFEELEEKIAKLEAERDHWRKIAMAQSNGGQ